jgi:hypothetical protein
MSLKLNSSSGGSVTLQEPSTATNGVLTLPAGTGSVVANGLNSALVSGTTQTTTSGTAIEFTSIPSWVKRITVMYSGVSLSGTSNPIIQLGSTTYTTSGYLGSASTGAGTAANMSAGFIISNASAAADTAHGMSTLATLNGLIWTFTSIITYSNQAATRYASGSITMAGTVDRLRIQATNGSDTFDAGNINILYE